MKMIRTLFLSVIASLIWLPLSFSQGQPEKAAAPPPKEETKLPYVEVGPPRPQPPPKLTGNDLGIKRLPMPNDAYRAASTDLAKLPLPIQPFIRYIWVDDNDRESAQSVAVCLNRLSRNVNLPRPLPIMVDGALILRINLTDYAPQPDDLQEWIDTWEDLQNDPRFNLLITKDTLRFAVHLLPEKEQPKVKQKKIVTVPSPAATQPAFAPMAQPPMGPPKKDGPPTTTVVEGEVLLKDAKDVDLIRVAGRHLDPQLVALLVARTKSQAPVVSHSYFIFRTMSAIKDKGLYAQIYGGRYYEFSGIKKAKKGTDEDLLFETLGVGNVAQGVTAKQIYDKLRSDQRVAVFRSGVTASPRRIDFFRTLSGRLDRSIGLISVTHDLRMSDIDIGTHPIANLLDFKDAAREVIFDKSNGLHGYVLLNGEGNRQDNAPDDVVKDHTIPQPFHARLQPAISCISCHEAEGSDGWKPVKNDVKLLLNKYLDAFGDLSEANKTTIDTLNRLAGLYQGEPEWALKQGRDNYARAILDAGGPWKAADKGAQVQVIKAEATKTVSIWRKYWYDSIDAKQALAELGWNVPQEKSLETLRKLLPPDASSAVDVGFPEMQRIIPEDFRIGALLSGASLNRAEWDLVSAFAAARMQQTVASLPPPKEEEQPKEQK